MIVASPCSGHGFKFSCLIGRVLADLTTSGETDFAVDAWRLKPEHVVENQRNSTESSPN